MLADAEGIDADLVSQHALVDDVADHLRVRQRLPVGADRNVAKGIQSELEILCHFCLLAGVDAAYREVDVASQNLPRGPGHQPRRGTDAQAARGQNMGINLTPAKRTRMIPSAVVIPSAGRTPPGFWPPG